MEKRLINMGKLSVLFDVLDKGIEYKLTEEDFGKEYRQIAEDICWFLNRYNRPAYCKHFNGYTEIYC